jgi:transposase
VNTPASPSSPQTDTKAEAGTGFVSLENEVISLRAQVQNFAQQVEHLEAKNEWLRRAVFGTKSERRPVAQDLGAAEQQNFLTMPVTAAAVDSDVAQAAAEQQEAQKHTSELTAAQKRNAKKGLGPDGKQKAKNGGGRRPVNRSLRPVELIIEASASERIAADGTPLVLLGYETSTREHYIAAELVLQTIKRERWGLPDTRELVFVAPPPATMVPKGKYSDDAIIEAMYRKYVMCLPFGRMLNDFRAMGSDLSDSQLSDLAGRFAAFLSPIAAAIRDQVLARAFVHVDETPLPTLDGRRTIWAWVGGNQTFFHIGGRGGNELRKVLGLPIDDDGPTDKPAEEIALGETLGWVFTHWMADGYRPYDTIANEAGIIRLCCWVHARRGFIIPGDQGDLVAKNILDRIGELYRIERDTKHADDAERQRRRQTDSTPILEGIRTACQDALLRYDQASTMHKALAYILNRWEGLTVYTTRGDLPIDNNQAERVLRPIVIGRKNWNFIGSEDATAWAATNFTIFESCRLAKAEPRTWLRLVITRIHAGDTDYATMTPANCAKLCPVRVPPGTKSG